MDKKITPETPDPSQKKPPRTVPMMGGDILTARGIRPFPDPELVLDLYREPEKYLNYDDLTLAAMVGDRGKVEDLVRAGADIDGSPEIKTSPLIKSLSAEQVDISKFLLESGANPNIANESGLTALHLACSLGFEALVAEIVDRGGDVNAKTDYGMTSLMFAARSGFPGIVKILLTNRADVLSKDFTGMTALIHAAVGGEDESGGDFHCVEALVSHGADVNAQAVDGTTALMAVACGGDARSVKLLLANNADVSPRNKQGSRALEMAEMGKQEEIVRILRDYTA